MMHSLHQSPFERLREGVPLTDKLVQLFYCELFVAMADGQLAVEQRPGHAGYFLVLTESGRLVADCRAAPLVVDVTAEKGLSTLNAADTLRSEETAALLSSGMVRFKDIKVSSKFKIQVGKTTHKLVYYKVCNADEDNARTDTETPELCSFPANQLVFPVK